MLRRLMLIAAAVGAIALLPAGGATAASGGCALSGKANVSPPLKTDPHHIDYTFHGRLSSCQGLSKIHSGRIRASGSGTGSCGGNETKGRGRIRWNTGASSRISFKTVGAGVDVTVTGRVTGGKFKGSHVGADLVFQTDHPQDCADGGVADPTFDGTASIGP